MNTLTIGCITNYGMGVHKPKSIRVAVSDDNATYRDINELEYTSAEIFREGTFIEDLSIDMRGTVARYVRVTMEGAENAWQTMSVPDKNQESVSMN